MQLCAKLCLFFKAPPARVLHVLLVHTLRLRDVTDLDDELSQKELLGLCRLRRRLFWEKPCRWLSKWVYRLLHTEFFQGNFHVRGLKGVLVLRCLWNQCFFRFQWAANEYQYVPSLCGEVTRLLKGLLHRQNQGKVKWSCHSLHPYVHQSGSLILVYL